MEPGAPLSLVDERELQRAPGAGFGAALPLDDAACARGERIAAQAEQVDLDRDPGSNKRCGEALAPPGRPGYV